MKSRTLLRVHFVEFHARSLTLPFHFCSYHFAFQRFLMLGTDAAIFPSLNSAGVRDKKFAVTVHPVLSVKIRSGIARQRATRMLRRLGNHEVTAVR